jgi:MFS transporter, FSR family, fosmidomycin resistance protein
MMKSRFLGLHPTVILLASTHFLVDGYGNIYAPLLPLLIPQMQLSLTTVGVLQMCFQISNSVSQLAFGRLADKWHPRILLVAGPLFAVSILSLIGLSTNAWTLGMVLVAGGLGGAMFHPPAAALVHRVSGRSQAFAMSCHITGGSIGFSMGPLMFAPLAQRYGLSWTPVFMIPGLVVLAFLLRRIPSLSPLQGHHESANVAGLRQYARPLTLLYFIVVIRTLTALAFSTFMPVMLTRRGMSVADAGVIAAVYLFSTSVGGFFGGALADRWGARRIIIASLVSSVPFLAVAPTLSGWPFVVMLCIGGFLLQSTLPVNVTFAQVIAPISAATVSSLMMGFAWGTGGLSVPLVGLLADRTGIEHALTLMSFLPLVAAALALPLPEPQAAFAPRTPAVNVPETSGTDVAP